MASHLIYQKLVLICECEQTDEYYFIYYFILTPLLIKDNPFTKSDQGDPTVALLRSFKKHGGYDSLQQFVMLPEKGCREQTVINIHRRGRGGGRRWW